MTVAALALFAYSLVLLLLLPSLGKAGWTARTPGPSLWLWHALVAGLVTSALLALVSLCVLPVASPHRIAGVLDAGLGLAPSVVASPGAWAAILAALATISFLRSSAITRQSTSWAWSRTLREQKTALRVLGTPKPDGYVLVNSGEPVAYCLPGDSRQIVLTSGAVERLDADELKAVIAHERAHQRLHHHGHLNISRFLSHVIPRPVAAIYVSQIARLVELHADEQASTTVDRVDLASAIVSLGTARGTGRTGLAANVIATAERVRRLLEPSPPPASGSLLSLRLLAFSVIASPPMLIAVLSMLPATRMCSDLLGIFHTG